MHENVIIITVDELTANIVNKTLSNGVKTTPFMEKLSSQSVVAASMYSQAPYTEAAMRNLLYGHDVLDKLENILLQPDFDFTYFKYLKQYGYDVFCMSTDLHHSCNEKEIYSQVITMKTWKGLYENRLKEFENYVMINGENQSYQCCYDILMNMMNSYINFMKLVLDKSECVKHYNRYYGMKRENCVNTLKFFMKEKTDLQKEPRNYIRKFYQDKRYLELDCQGKFTKKQFMENTPLRLYAVQMHNKLMNIIQKKSFFINLKNQRITRKALCGNVRKINKKNLKKYVSKIELLFINYINLIKESHIQFYGKESTISGIAESLGLFNSFYEYLDHRDKKVPFFAYMQPVEVHGPADFFNVHTKGREEIDEEYELAISFIDSLPKDFKGSVNYYVTVRIIDERIKKFYTELEKRKLTDNTYFIITSDHGTSYMYDKIRPDMVNNFYDTQYHIPFILHHPHLGHQVIEHFSYSKDIPATIFELLNIPKPCYFSGHNLLDSNYSNQYIIHEYMGGGCPDFYHKPIRLCIRNRQYKVVYYANLGEKFSGGAYRGNPRFRKGSI